MPDGGVVIRRKHLLIAGAMLAVIAVTILVTVLVVNRPTESSTNADETQRILRLVGKHFELPTTEQPTVAKIQDMSKLADQQFFARAHNGDYLLVYKTERIAFIYRQSADRLINVGPITFDTEQKLQNK